MNEIIKSVKASLAPNSRAAKNQYEKRLDETDKSSIIYRPLMVQVCTQLNTIKTSLHA
jgi:hypothetical protein